MTEVSAKSQPWKAIWPPKNPGPQLKAAQAAGGGGNSGNYGYNDEGEIIGPKQDAQPNNETSRKC